MEQPRVGLYGLFAELRGGIREHEIHLFSLSANSRIFLHCHVFPDILLHWSAQRTVEEEEGVVLVVVVGWAGWASFNPLSRYEPRGENEYFRLAT